MPASAISVTDEAAEIVQKRHGMASPSIGVIHPFAKTVWHRRSLPSPDIPLGFDEQQGAARKIQGLYRGREARKKVMRMKRAAICIQAVFRGYRTRRILSTATAAALTRCMNIAALHIQCAWRGYSTRKVHGRSGKLHSSKRVSVMSESEAATAVQTWWRAHRTRDVAQRIVANYKLILETASAVNIQRMWRGHIARSTFVQTAAQLASEKKQRLHAIHTIQRVYRGHRARSLASQLRRRKEDAMIEAGAVMVQRLYRGYRVRKQVSKKKKNQWYYCILSITAFSTSQAGGSWDDPSGPCRH